MARGVTLKDIAQETGYTINTVSRALRGRSDISVATREKIQQVANEMGYVKNSLASSLRSGKTGIVAIIISDISNPLFGIMAKHMEEQLEKKGHCVIILNTDEDEEKERNAISLAMSKKVDGVIICPVQRSENNIRLLKDSSIPFVLMGRRFKQIETDYVIWDDVGGGYQATRFLLGKGHRDIIFFNGPCFLSSAQERREGYCRAYQEAGLQYHPEYIKEISINNMNISRQVHEVVSSKLPFSAVLTFNDVMAWSVKSELDFIGMENIEVMGFDNIQSRFRIPYGLSSVNTAKEKMAVMVTDILLKKICGEEQGVIQKIIEVDLAIR